MRGDQTRRPVLVVFVIFSEFPPLRTVEVSEASEVLLLFFVHLLTAAEVAVFALSIVAEPSKPPSRLSKLCPHPCEAKAKKARIKAAKPLNRVKG